MSAVGFKASRTTRLTGDGLFPAGGSPAAYLVCEPQSAEATFNKETGDKITKKSGMGNPTLRVNRPDVTVDGTLKITFASASFGLQEHLANGPISLLGGATPTGIGFTAIACGSIIARGGVFVELWSENWECSAISATNPFIRTVFPRWTAEPEGITLNSQSPDIVFSGPFVQSVVKATAEDGGPFEDILGATLDHPYLWIQQNDTTVPDCTVTSPVNTPA